MQVLFPTYRLGAVSRWCVLCLFIVGQDKPGNERAAPCPSGRYQIESPRVSKRPVCSKLRRLFQDHSSLHGILPPVLAAADGQWRCIAARCCISLACPFSQGHSQVERLCLESGGNSPAASSERVDLRLIKRRGQGAWVRSVCRGSATRRPCAW